MLEKIGLSDIDLSHCIYMSAGDHADEKFEDIVVRKQRDEIEKHGWSLWAFSSPIAEKLYEFCKKHNEIYVVMPVTGENTKGDEQIASYWCEYDKECKKKYCKECDKKENNRIPEGMKVTYTSSKAYALVVEKYFLVDEKDAQFIKGNYERVEYFNGVEILEEKSEKADKNYKNISLVAKLKDPYIAWIK